ncbi:MAG: hypothetical protein ABIA37_03495 [Candidatus Woesearchaeota archaeon]
MNLNKILTAAAVAAGVSLITDNAEAEKKVQTATVTIDRNAVKVSKSNKGKKRRARARFGLTSICGLDRTVNVPQNKCVNIGGQTYGCKEVNLADYQCLTKNEARLTGLDPSAGLKGRDYTRNSAEMCPGVKRCYDISSLHPQCNSRNLSACDKEGDCKKAGGDYVNGTCQGKTKDVLGPERVVERTKVVPGPERIIERTKVVSTPTCNRAAPSACQDEKSCLTAKCNWYDNACHTEAKPEEKGPQYNWNAGVFTQVYGGDGLQVATGAQAGRRIVKGLEAFVRAGHLWGSDNHATNNTEVSSETELLPDNTTYKKTEERVNTAQADARNRGFVGAGLKYVFGPGKKVSAAVFGGADVRLGEEHTAKAYSETNSLIRNDQNLRDPKTITNQEQSSETAAEVFGYGGLGVDLNLGKGFTVGLEGVVGGTSKGKLNAGGGPVLRYNW